MSHDWGNYPGDEQARGYITPVPSTLPSKPRPPENVMIKEGSAVEKPKFGKSNFMIEFYSNLTSTELRALINRALTEETKAMGLQGSRVSSFIVQECV